MVGQFVPDSRTDRVFSLARYKIQCCGADAVQLNVPIVCRDSVKEFSKEDWVRVTGRVEFLGNAEPARCFSNDPDRQSQGQRRQDAGGQRILCALDKPLAS